LIDADDPAFPKSIGVRSSSAAKKFDAGEHIKKKYSNNRRMNFIDIFMYQRSHINAVALDFYNQSIGMCVIESVCHQK
jgi:hypothetical protein